MAKKKTRTKPGAGDDSVRQPRGRRFAKRPIEQYDHSGKERVNIPPVGLVTPETDPDPATLPAPKSRKTYQYDPHLDPQLVWAGKAERLSFEVPTVSLHVHERIDPRTIIEAVRVRNGNGHATEQLPLFGRPEENPPLRDAVEFYKHRHNWTNRLIAGDSLLVMNSLLEKEGLGGQVQMVYIDPPYGIRYGSNFQPFTNKRDVKDGSDDDLTLEPETLKAFRDTWELGIHSYLTYLRDRLLLAKELLHESGSCFVQISDENIHHIREMMDEVFDKKNFVALIAFYTTTGFPSNTLPRAGDYLLWYAKQIDLVKYRPLYTYQPRKAGDSGYRWIQLADGSTRAITTEELREGFKLPKDARLYIPDNLVSQGAASERQPFKYKGKTYEPPANSHWKPNYPEGLERLATAGRLHVSENTLRYIRDATDFEWKSLNNVWDDTVTGQFTDPKIFVVQTNTKVAARCLLMTTDPGDLVFDPTCGSGTTAYVAEQWGRRWITTDTSRVAITLAKQRLMTATFDYYTLAHPEQGVGSGFKYRTVKHVTLKSIATNPWIKEGITREEIDAAIDKNADRETLYDKPDPDHTRARVTGPFTVEAVPAAAFGQPEVKPVTPIEWDDQSSLPGMDEGDRLQADSSVARQGETLRQSEWRTELFKTGIRGKGGAKIEFVRVEPLPGTRWLSADAETKEEKPVRAVISFGPEHAPLEQRQVTQALEEASQLVPRPKMVVFAALQFDPEAAKDIDETNWPGVAILKAQMNGDLVTEDLKKKRSSNESFWLMGQPDVLVERIQRGEHTGKWEVEVHGFDYYNPKTGKVESGGVTNIAMWMLDTDYDGRSVYPRQVFFPMAGTKDGWSRLAKDLKAEIDQDLIESYRGSVSIPFAIGRHRRIAVKIVDDRGIESLRVFRVEK